MVLCDFQAHANGLDMFWHKGSFLPDDAAFVPGRAAGANGG